MAGVSAVAPPLPQVNVGRYAAVAFQSVETTIDQCGASSPQNRM